MEEKEAETLKGIQSMLGDYYGLYVPRGELLKAISANESACEAFQDGSVYDTADREIYAEAVLEYIGMESRGSCGNIWPLNGDTDEYAQQFSNELKEKIKKVDGSFASEY